MTLSAETSTGVSAGVALPAASALRVGARLALLALAAALVLVAASVPFLAVPDAQVDDGLFARLAVNILRYGWLGPYDQLTLAKSPFYPLFLAASSLTGLPFLAVQTAAYAASSLLLAWAVGLLCGSRAVEFACAVALLLNPVLFAMDLLHVTREGIYVPLTVLVVALGLLCYAERERIFVCRLFLAVATGFAAAAFWLTREEGVWILPSLALIVAADILAVWSRGSKAIATEITLIGAAAATAAACVGAVCVINAWQYGVYDVVEFKQPEFVDAYAALARIDGPEVGPHVRIGWARLGKAYEASPTAAELQPTLRAMAPALVGASCDGDGPAVLPCDGEIHDAWLLWGLRYAAAASGHYRTAREARDFWRQLAHEVDFACDDGRLACGPARRSLLRPIDWRDVPAAFDAAGQMVWTMSTLGGQWWRLHGTKLWRFRLPPVSCATADPLPPCRDQRWFFDLLHTQLFVMAPGWLGPDDTHLYASAQRESMSLSSTRIAMRIVPLITHVRLAVTSVLPWAAGFALVCYLAAGIAQLSPRRRDAAWFAASVCAGLIVSRIGFLAIVNTLFLYTETRVIYLSPGYPFFFAFCILGPTSLWRCIDLRRRRLPRAPVSHVGLR